MTKLIIGALMTGALLIGGYLGFLGGIAIGAHDYSAFYDGEGNEIPASAVRLLVEDQFVILSPKEDSALNRYFYFRKPHTH